MQLLDRILLVCHDRPPVVSLLRRQVRKVARHPCCQHLPLAQQLGHRRQRRRHALLRRGVERLHFFADGPTALILFAEEAAKLLHPAHRLRV